ncbi:MAG: hypothetical protein C5B59_09655 [Bacteroidetes bacterium]|nr:MAG: hypothetical protein C5B59_09655 [Bacteroidota bacterium]
MKHFFSAFFLSVAISFFCTDSMAQNCDDSSINLGVISDHWVYRNKSFKLNMQLPEGWYLFDYPATEKKYLRIGSDYSKMSSVLFDNAPDAGPTVDIGQIKPLPVEYALTVLSLAKLQDTADVVLSGNEIQQNYTVSLRVAYADTSGEDNFLKAFYKKLTRQQNKEAEIKEGKLGDLNYKYILLHSTTKSGVAENRIFGIKNFGCVDLIIRMTYDTDADLSVINDVFKELKMDSQ